MTKTVGLYADPQFSGEDLSGLSGGYVQYIRTRIRPRDESYMKKLFMEHYPRGAFLNVSRDKDWRTVIEQAEQIVMLYPDGNGSGFSALEVQTIRLKKKTANLYVLNGRRRSFRLTRSVRWQLKLRRFMEQAMIAQICFTVLFFILTPIFWCIDLLIKES